MLANSQQLGMITDAQLAPVAELLLPVIAEHGFDPVRICFGAGGQSTLQIMVDRPDGAPLIVEDCARLSRALSAVLDEKDPVAGEYMLEVSSPGIDRPLTRVQDFAKWAGFEVRVETKGDHNGRTRFHGQILGVADNTITLREETGDVELGFGTLKKAKLVLNDQLLAATKRAA